MCSECASVTAQHMRNSAQPIDGATGQCQQRTSETQLKARLCMSRLSFSALGDQLAVVNTNDGDLCTLMLCNREHWSDSVQLVGHDGTVVASRYSPCVFGAPDGGQDNKRSGADGEGEVARVRLRLRCPPPARLLAHAGAARQRVRRCVCAAALLDGLLCCNGKSSGCSCGCHPCASPGTSRRAAQPTPSTVVVCRL